MSSLFNLSGRPRLISTNKGDNPFESLTDHVQASRIAKAYIQGLFQDQISKPIDLSKQSIVLSYYGAFRQLDLKTTQEIADWVLWVMSWHPDYAGGLESTYLTIGRSAYYRAYRLVPSWTVWEELADTLPSILAELSS